MAAKQLREALISVITGIWTTFTSRVVLLFCAWKAHHFLEEVPDSLVVAPLLDSGQQPVVELLVDLIELRHFEEDGFYLSYGEHRLRRCGCGLQRLHGLGERQRP